MSAGEREFSFKHAVGLIKAIFNLREYRKYFFAFFKKQQSICCQLKTILLIGLLTLLMTFSILRVRHEITQVNDMKEVFDAFNDADSNTLVIFDVDMVLIQPSDPAFQMANMKRFSAISKRIMKEVPTDKQMMFLSLMTISSDPVLIDDRTPQFLDQIIRRGVPAMALTANLTGKFGTIPNMEQWRVDGLRQLGIDFTKTAPCQKVLVFDDLASLSR